MDIHSKHIKLYEGSNITLKALKFALDKANVASIIKNNSNSGRLAGFAVNDNDNDIFVFEEDAIIAKKVLEQFLAQNL